MKVRRLNLPYSAFIKLKYDEVLRDEFYMLAITAGVSDVGDARGCMLVADNVLNREIEFECNGLPCNLCAFCRENYEDDGLSVKQHGKAFAWFTLEKEVVDFETAQDCINNPTCDAIYGGEE